MPKQILRIAGILCLLLILTSALITNATAAGEMFIWSEPSLFATLQGDSEVYPGTDVAFAIVVENQGVDNEGLRGLQYMTYSINPTTALGTTLDLNQGDAPLRIKTEPFMAGDIKAGEEKTGTFYAHIDENAKKGTYNLILYADYNYVFAESLIEQDRWDYTYKGNIAAIKIPIEIKGAVKPQILSVSTKNLVPGENGDITVVVKNIGYNTGYNSAAELSGTTGIIRSVDGSVFLGDFAPGETKEIVFSADVKDTAAGGIYPETLTISYTDEYGKLKESVSENFGVKVSKGAKFKIVSENILMNPGEEKTIEVSFLNYGDEIAYGAKARIVPDTPLNGITDTAIIGDIAPRETKNAVFTISMDSDALIIPYGINTQIKYRDDFDRLILSKQMKLPVSAQKGNIIADIITNPIALAILVGVVFLCAYYLYRKKQKK